MQKTFFGGLYCANLNTSRSSSQRPLPPDNDSSEFVFHGDGWHHAAFGRATCDGTGGRPPRRPTARPPVALPACLPERRHASHRFCISDVSFVAVNYYALALKTEPEPNKLRRQSKDSSTRTRPPRMFASLSVPLLLTPFSWPSMQSSATPRRLNVSSTVSPRAQTPCSPPTFAPAQITTWARVVVVVAAVK